MASYRARVAFALASLALLLCVRQSAAAAASTIFENSSSDSLLFDVTTYGAVNDGRTDCTHAVFLAVQALANATMLNTTTASSATLYFPAGTFLFNSAPPFQPAGDPGLPSFVDFSGVQASRPFSLSVTGAGVQETTILWAASLGTFLQTAIASGLPNPGNSVTLTNLTLNTAPNGGYGSVLNINGAKEVVISNANFGFNSSILGSALASVSLTIDNVVANYYDAGYNGLSVTSPSINIVDSTFNVEPVTHFNAIYIMNGLASMTVSKVTTNGWQGVFYLPDGTTGAFSVMNVQVSQSQFNDFNYVLQISTSSNLVLEIESSSFSTTDQTTFGGRTVAVDVQNVGNASSVTLTALNINGPFAAVQLSSPVTLVMDSNVIQNVSYGVLFWSDSGSPLGASIESAMQPFVVKNNKFIDVQLNVATFMQSLTGAALPGASTFDGNECDGTVNQVVAPCENGQACSFNKNTGCELVAQQSLQQFDVTQFGAVGDGKTDCTQAVLKATTALLALPSGGQLHFPKGQYLFSSSPTPCAQPGQGSCAFIALMTVTAFTNPAARIVVNGDPNGGTSILWGSQQGQFIQFQPDLFGAPIALEVFDLNIQAQTSAAPATGNYTAISAVGTYAYVHNVNIVGAKGSSGALLLNTQAPGGSSMLVETVILLIDPEVGVGLSAYETSGLALRDVTFDSLDGSVGDSSSTAAAIIFNEYSTYILIDSCTFQPGSRLVSWIGMNDGNAMPFLLRNSSFTGVALSFNTQLSITVDSCSFIGGASGLGGMSIGTDYIFENTFLTVTGSAFQNLKYGINAGWGRVVASNNVFHSCGVGVEYAENQQYQPLYQPVVLTNNQFITTATSQFGALVFSGSGWIVANNVCTGPAYPSMKLTCTSSCTESNNVGCGTLADLIAEQ